MSPHYSRPLVPAPSETNGNLAGGQQTDAMDMAAEAIRQAEVEAVQTEPEPSMPVSERLEEMSIDELRRLAAELDVPDRGKIIEQDELIAAIKRRLPASGRRPK
jgi:hypothetical protein